MGWMTLEHSRTIYRADFMAYGLGCTGLATALALLGPAPQRLQLLAWVLAGLTIWTLAEYLLHRFVLHGLKPFSSLHGEHHRRPAARICTPTLVSAGLMGALVWMPAWWLAGIWPAAALTLGVLTGYLAYSVLHHVDHHGRSRHPWLLRRQRWHAVHHQAYRAPPMLGMQPGNFGVTTMLWDHVFRTAPRGPCRPRGTR